MWTRFVWPGEHKCLPGHTHVESNPSSPGEGAGRDGAANEKRQRAFGAFRPQTASRSLAVENLGPQLCGAVRTSVAEERERQFAANSAVHSMPMVVSG